MIGQTVSTSLTHATSAALTWRARGNDEYEIVCVGKRIVVLKTAEGNGYNIAVNGKVLVSGGMRRLWRTFQQAVDAAVEIIKGE